MTPKILTPKNIINDLTPTKLASRLQTKIDDSQEKVL